MDHLCKAIRAGAFSGPEWFPWRTALASNPHISAAHTLLDVFPPPKTYARPHSPPGIIYGVAAAFILADMIEPFISEGRPIKKRGAPVQFDPRDDTKVYNAWHTGQYRTYAECAKALGAGSTPKSVEKAIDRHEKRLKNQSRQA